MDSEKTENNENNEKNVNNSVNKVPENAQESKSAIPSGGKTKPNYYIPDLAAQVSDDESETTQSVKRSSRTKAKSYKDTDYINAIQEEADSSHYNKELLKHIRNTQIREKRRKIERQGFDSSAPSTESEFRTTNFQESNVRIKYRNDGTIVDEEEDFRTENVLPSIKDPKLWKVSCAIGKERGSVFEILDIYKRRQKTENRLFINSAFTTDISKGYFYIEAFKKAHVIEAASLIRSIYQRGIKLVPMTEMTDTLETKRKKNEIRVNSWVRINRGIHKGDLAKVTNVLEDGYKVDVKVVPRIDFSSLKANILNPLEGKRQKKKKGKLVRSVEANLGGLSLENEIGENDEAGESQNEQKAKAKLKVPPARLFNEAEVRRFLKQFSGDVQVESLFRKGRGETYFKGQRFVDGYKIHRATVTTLGTKVIPTEEEIARFNIGSRGSEEAAEITDQRHMENRLESFRIEDHVRVITGDLANLTGTVKSIRSGVIYIDPDAEEINHPLGFSANELQKDFKIGAHVKILSGVYKDETGFVTKSDFENGRITVYSDIENKNMDVSAMNAAECSEISSGKNQLGGYSLLDFVQLDTNSCGLIVQVLRRGLIVLTDKGELQKVELKDIKGKRNTRNIYALDKNSNQITSGDIVKVVNKHNKYANTVATVQTIYKNVVFLRCPEIRENCSTFVAPARSLLVSGAKRPQRGKKSSIHGKNHADFTSDIRRDSLTGKYVLMVGGVYKGQHGLVKAMPNLQKLLVELLTENKIVTVDRCNAEVSSDGSLESISKNSATKTPVLGLKTPQVPNTPLHDSRSIKTPSYGSRSARSERRSQTPRHETQTPSYGGKTPVYGNKTTAYGRKTPNYGIKTPSYDRRTPNYNRKTPLYDGKTPVYGSKTPMYGSKTSMYGKKTPNYGNKTPMYGNKTPVYGNKTPMYGSKTPMYDNKTPMHGNKTPVYDQRKRTPSYPRNTPNYPKSPGHGKKRRASTPSFQQRSPDSKRSGFEGPNSRRKFNDYDSDRANMNQYGKSDEFDRNDFGTGRSDNNLMKDSDGFKVPQSSDRKSVDRSQERRRGPQRSDYGDDAADPFWDN